MRARFRTWARYFDVGLLSAARARFLLGGFGVLLLAGVALLIVGRSGRSMEPVDVRLAGPVVPHSVPAGLVRVAVGPGLASPDGFDRLAAYLEQRLERPVAVVESSSSGTLGEQLSAGKVQAAMLDTGAYLEARRRDLEVEAIAVPSYGGATHTQAIVVVGIASPVHALADLRGRSFAFTDPRALAGHDYPVVAIRRSGFEPETFFSRTLFTHGDEASLRAVRNGDVEAAALEQRAFDRVLATHAPWRAGLRIVHRSPPFGAGPVAVPANLAPDLRRGLERAWLEMHGSAEGRALLQAMQISRFEPPRADLYDFASQLVSEARATVGGGP